MRRHLPTSAGLDPSTSRFASKQYDLGIWGTDLMGNSIFLGQLFMGPLFMGKRSHHVSEKPSYLGLLNAISLGESEAHCYLNAWADATPSSEVKAVILTVAHREGEHGLSFAKRINELGYGLIPKDNQRFAEQMAIAGSDRTDLEKFELLGLGREESDKPDIFASMFNDTTIDITTGQLLGRYIAEERDSGRLLRHCHSLLKEAAECEMPGATGASSAQLSAIDTKVDALCRAVDELRQIVCAQTMEPAAAGNSKRK
jgi:rubrerythrin